MKPKPFKKLTAAQKRVAIAKDVISQIKARRFIIRRGHYFRWKSERETDGAYQKSLIKSSAQCTVCAIGGAIASGIRLFNQISCYPYMQTEEAFEAAKRWFSKNQIVAIEVAFESGMNQAMEREYNGNPSLNKRASDFADRFSDSPTSLAMAIFRNIIRNKGEFVP